MYLCYPHRANVDLVGTKKVPRIIADISEGGIRLPGEIQGASKAAIRDWYAFLDITYG